MKQALIFVLFRGWKKLVKKGNNLYFIVYNLFSALNCVILSRSVVAAKNLFTNLLFYKHNFFRKPKLLLIFFLLIFIVTACQKEIMSPTGDVVTLSISPDTVSVKKGGTYRFSVVGYDKNGNYVNVTPTWSVESNYGVINNKGYFYIKYDLQAPYPKTEYVVAQYNNLSVKAKVTVILGDFWIFSDVNTQDFLYDYPDPRPVFGGKLGTWGVCKISEDTSDYPDTSGGGKSLKIDYTNTGGGGVFWVFCDSLWTATNENMSSYTNSGKLEFWVKSTNNLEIKIEDSSAGSSKYLSNYINLTNNEWQEVSIPLKEFSGIDFSKLKTIIGFHSTSSGIAHIDEVRYTAE